MVLSTPWVATWASAAASASNLLGAVLFGGAAGFLALFV